MGNELALKMNLPDWFEAIRSSGNALASQSSAFNRVPLVFHAFNLRANALGSVPVKCYKKTKVKDAQGKPQDVEMEWPYRTTPEALAEAIEQSLMIGGKACIVPNFGVTTGKVRDLQVLNPFRVSVQVNADGTLKFIYAPDNAAVVEYDESQLIYIREYNPDNDIDPGPGAVSVAMNDARLLFYLSKFPGAFFEGGAMPVTVLSVKTTLESEVLKVVDWFKQRMIGLANAFGVFGVRADGVTAQTITPALNTLSMPELKLQATEAIAYAFDLPITMVTDAANYATAAQHDQQFWETVIEPRARKIERVLNKYFKDQGFKIKFAFNELKAYQEDDSKQAATVGQYVTAGMPLLIAIDVAGVKLTDEQRADLEKFITEKEAAAQALQDNLAKQPTTPADQGNKPMMDNQGKPTDKPMPPKQDAGNVRSALYNWKAAALAGIKTGHGAAVDFDNPVIPEATAEAIRYELEACTTADEVHAVFKQARGWIDNPPDLGAEIAKTNALLARFVEITDAVPTAA